MAITANELSFLRLLERTKKLSREDLPENVWKVRSSASYLATLLSKMQDEKGGHNPDVLMQYGREVHQLNLLVDAEQKRCAEEKLNELDKIPSRFPDFAAGPAATDSTAQTSSVIPESNSEIRARNRTVYRADLRRQLLGEDKRRKAEAQVDDVSRHEQMQEDLANELLSMTRSLRQNMTLAGNVIKDDNKRLVKMSEQVDSNKEKLAVEGARLEHHAYKCGTECFMIFVFLFIFWAFFAMVIVMKFFPKRVSV